MLWYSERKFDVALIRIFRRRCASGWSKESADYLAGGEAAVCLDGWFGAVFVRFDRS